MDHRLVVDPARGRRAEAVLHSGKPARRAGGRELRPLPAEHQDSPQGAQRRLASVRAQLLPPLPPGRAPRRAGRYIHEPCRIPMRRSRKEKRTAMRFPRRQFLHLATAAAAVPAVWRSARAETDPARPPSELPSRPLADRLAAYAAALRYDDLDAATIERVKSLLID